MGALGCKILKVELIFVGHKILIRKRFKSQIINKFYFFSLVLRIRCEAENAQCPLGAKFGCDPFFEAPKLLKAAKSMALNVVGISFHVGSGCRDYPIYYKAIGICKNLFEQGEDLGFNMSLLDIGGGKKILNFYLIVKI